jgi:hypothetical protein
LRQAEFGRNAAQRSRRVDQIEQPQVLKAKLEQGGVHGWASPISVRMAQ